jgi:putative transposase
MVYIDLNMVRAGVVEHPADWPFAGYTEILGHRERYRLINKKKIQELINVDNEQMLKEYHKRKIETSLSMGDLERKSCWTESVAIGSKEFVEKIKDELGVRAVYRKIIKNKEIHELREPGISYTLNFIGKMNGLRVKIFRVIA